MPLNIVISSANRFTHRTTRQPLSNPLNRQWISAILTRSHLRSILAFSENSPGAYTYITYITISANLLRRRKSAASLRRGQGSPPARKSIYLATQQIYIINKMPRSNEKKVLIHQKKFDRSLQYTHSFLSSFLSHVRGAALLSLLYETMRNFRPLNGGAASTDAT